MKISKRRKAGEGSLKVIPTIRHKKIPISSAKKSDLVKLCKTGAIPGVFLSYESLPSNRTVNDRLPVPDALEEDIAYNDNF